MTYKKWELWPRIGLRRYSNSILPETGDDSLLHELVHAYRYSYNKFQPVNIDLRFMEQPIQETEEVLAHQMENIYLSQVNRPLTLEYHYAQTADKKTIYDFLVGNWILPTLFSRWQKEFFQHAAPAFEQERA